MLTTAQQVANSGQSKHKEDRFAVKTHTHSTLQIRAKERGQGEVGEKEVHSGWPTTTEYDNLPVVLKLGGY